MSAKARMQERSIRAAAYPLRKTAELIDRLPLAIVFRLTCAVALIVYAPAITNAFEFDDINVLYRSIIRVPNLFALVREFDGQTTGGSWRPFLHVVLWLEWHVFGTNAVPYHVINVLAHAATVFALGLLALELTRRRAAAFFAAAVFMFQPLPEGVAWIVGGPLNVMSVAFYLAALVCHARARRSPLQRYPRLMIVFLILSLSSYEIALTFGAAVVAYDVLFYWREWTWRERLRRTGATLGAVLLVDVVFVLLRALVLGVFLGSYGANAIFGFGAITTRFGSVIDTLWSPINTALPQSASGQRGVFVLHLTVIAAAVIWFTRPRLAAPVFAIFLAVLALVPFAGFISISASLVSTRYLYLTVAGLALGLGALLGTRPRLGAIAAVPMTTALALLLAINVGPWAIAGAMVESTAAAAHGGPLQVFGVPVHDYYGAYTFGTTSNIPEYPGANGIDVLLTSASIDPVRRLMYWDGVRALAPLDALPVARWSAADLSAWNWGPSATLDMDDGVLTVISADGDPYSWSPELTMPSERTNVVVVGIDIAPGTCNRSQLISRYAIAGDRSVTVELAPGSHEYVFVLPAAIADDMLVGLRFDPLICPGTVRVLGLEVGGRTSPGR